MLRVIARRLLVMPFLILGIVTATFVLAQFTKGNPLVSIIGRAVRWTIRTSWPPPRSVGGSIDRSRNVT